MVRLLARTAVFLLAAAIGVVLTDVLFSATGWETFDVVWSDPLGFVVAVVLFAVVQAVMSPFFAQLARRNAPTLVGAVGLISTYVALLVASLVSDGLVIGGWQGWVIGPVIVWLVTMLATFLLPAFILKQAVEERRGEDRA